jgi:hypothetical protein
MAIRSASYGDPSRLRSLRLRDVKKTRRDDSRFHPALTRPGLRPMRHHFRLQLGTSPTQSRATLRSSNASRRSQAPAIG